MEPNSSTTPKSAPHTPTAADASVRVPGAHTDTFTRDHLPPPDQWPRLLLGPPGPRYPDRLNCGHELLDRTVEERGPTAPRCTRATGASGATGSCGRPWTASRTS